MNETKGCIVLLFLVFLLFFFFLMTVQVCTARKLDTFIQNQERINETTSEQDRQQSKDIRLLKQDAEISRSIITSKEFLAE